MNIAIIGGTGGMGQLYNRLLNEHGVQTHCFNRELKDFEENISWADIIMVTVPKQTIPSISSKLGKIDTEGKLLISLSSYFSDEDSLRALDAEYTFIHCMFGPDIKNIEGKNVLICPSQDERYKNIVSIFKKEKANISLVEDEEEHDTKMAYVQALSQFHSFVLGDMLSSSPYTYDEIKSLAPITLRHNLQTIDRLMKQDAELWAAIQFENNFFETILQTYKHKVEERISLVTNKDRKSFEGAFKDLKQYFDDHSKNKSAVTSNTVATSNTGTCGVLGPEGTYSHEAARATGIEQEDIRFYKSIPEVIEGFVSREVVDAIIPFENAIHGTVLEAIDNLYKYKLQIVDEAIIDINHVSAALSPSLDATDVTDVYSHPQALGQCAEYIRNSFPQAIIHTTGSTAGGFQKIQEEQLESAVAIGPQFAAELYSLNILEEKIADKENNQTLFVVLSHNENKVSTNESTLLALTVKEDRPGLLVDIMQQFKDQDINLEKIESRPSKEKLGTYIFYLKLSITPNDSRLTIFEQQANKIGVAVTKLSR